MAVVYKWFDIRNPDETLYVGATVNLRQRKWNHKSCFNGCRPGPFHRACKDRFDFLECKVLEECQAKDKLDRERYWYNQLKPQYGNRSKITREERYITCNRWRCTRGKEKIPCPICNKPISRRHMARHIRRLHKSPQSPHD